MSVQSLQRNEHGRLSPLVVLGLLASLLMIAVPATASHYQASLEGSEFEIDFNANLKVDSVSGFSDWASVDFDAQGDAPTGGSDDSFKGGTKEDTECPNVTTGSIPNNKSDLKTFGVYQEPGDPGYVHIFWSRVQDPSGTTLMDFEFNQSSVDCSNGNGFKQRTTDDLLVEYSITQGGSTANVTVRRWQGSNWGTAMNLSAVGEATGTINSSAIPANESVAPVGAQDPRTFGEASFNLDIVFESDECTSFGSVSLKSRSSDSFTSQLKDFIKPIGVNISNCGNLTINKTDDLGDPLDGAQFTAYVDAAPTNADGQTEPGAEDTTAGGSCTTVSGTCTISPLLAGPYWVVETVTPPNHDTADPQAAVVGADGTVELDFVNVRQKGSILVEKVDEGDNPLDGAAFTITPGDIVMTAVAGETGLFCTDDLNFGDYTVSETTTPAGYQTAPDQDFTVDEKSNCADRVTADDEPDLTFTNNPAPGKIIVNKADDDGAPLDGAGFTLYVDDNENGVHELGETTVAAVEQLTSSGTTTFENIDPGFYCAVETTTPSGYDTADPQCTEVTLGSNPNEGDEITLSFTNPQFHKVIVIVCHEGTDTLAPSDVTDGSDDYTSVGSGAVTDEQEAFLCGLSGHDEQPHGDKNVTVDVGSDAHG